MNLDNDPTIEELQALFAHADDNEGHHVLWVDFKGDVHLSVMTHNITPEGFEKENPTMKMRYEAFIQGNGHVGKEASSDTSGMRRILASLIKEWPDASRQKGVEFIDSY